MRFQLRFANQLVGVFVIAGVLFVAGAIVVLGTRQGWFEPRYAYYTEVETSRNLSIGMPIQYRGFDIGRVTGYELSERNIVEVDFVIFERYRYLVTQHSLLELSGNPLLGGRIVLHPGPSEMETLAAGSMIPEWDSSEGIALRDAGTVSRSQPPDAISRLLEDVNPVLDRVETVLAATDETIGMLNRTLSGEQTEGPMAETFTGINRLVDEAGNRLAESEVLLAQTEQLLGEVSTFTAELGEPEGLIPRLVGTQGSIARLFDDDDRLFLQLDAMLTSLNQSIVELNTLVTFFGDQTPQLSALLEDGRNALATTDDTIGMLNRTLSGEQTEGPMAETFTGINRLVDEAGNRLAESEVLLAQTEQLLGEVSTFTAELGEPEGLIPRLVGTRGSIGRLFDDDDRLFLQLDAMLTSLNESIVELNTLVTFFGDQTPQLSALLEEGRDALAVGQDVLTALRNNPLLRRGIPERRDPEAGFESLREGRF